MSKGHGPVIEHKTYVAAQCLRCTDVALRICIVHNACELEHVRVACDIRHLQILQKSVRIIQDANGPDFAYVLAEAKAANERIKARE